MTNGKSMSIWTEWLVSWVNWKSVEFSDRLPHRIFRSQLARSQGPELRRFGNYLTGLLVGVRNRSLRKRHHLVASQLHWGLSPPAGPHAVSRFGQRLLAARDRTIMRALVIYAAVTTMTRDLVSSPVHLRENQTPMTPSGGPAKVALGLRPMMSSLT